jgi:hypothetical protein
MVAGYVTDKCCCSTYLRENETSGWFQGKNSCGDLFSLRVNSTIIDIVITRRTYYVPGSV